MKTFTQYFKKRLRQRSQAGQAIILVALAMVGLLAFVGLVTDISLLFVRYTQLRRSVDSAAIAAAGQIRENRDYADIAMAARQFIRLHGLDPDRVLVQTCVTNAGDPELCTDPPRKLVRVIAQIDSPTTFLSLLGWGAVTLETSSLSETAALDVVLVLDTSYSMAYGTVENDYTSAAVPGFDVRSECTGVQLMYGGCCNDPGNGRQATDGSGDIIGLDSNVADTDYSDLVCQPFKQVRDAARQFIERLDFTRGDRIAFVTFDRNVEVVKPVVDGTTLPSLMTDEGVAVTTLDTKMGVHVNEEGTTYGCVQPEGSSVWTYDWLAPCTDTNLGGGIAQAMQTLTDQRYIRRTAVWVMIVLSDGSASTTNAANNLAGEIPPIGDYGWAGYCPDYTFCTDTSDPECGTPYCTDIDPQTRHFCNTDTGFPAYDAPGCDPLYDASDFTMDMADLAGLVTVRDNLAGNFIAMYSIGFGSDIKNFGEALMRYIADAGDNGNIDNNFYEDCRNDGVCGNEALSTYDPPGPCESATPREDCGQYWYAEENSGDLDRIFSEIASRLFTRLAR